MLIYLRFLKVLFLFFFFLFPAINIFLLNAKLKQTDTVQVGTDKQLIVKNVGQF